MTDKQQKPKAAPIENALDLEIKTLAEREGITYPEAFKRVQAKAGLTYQLWEKRQTGAKDNG